MTLSYGSPIFKAVQKKQCKVLYSYLVCKKLTPLVTNPTATLDRVAQICPVESRFCGCKRREKVVFDAPINPYVRSACFRNVAVGVNGVLLGEAKDLSKVRDHRVTTRGRRRSWRLASLAPLAFSSGAGLLSPV
jgi:hypothetical protein